MVPGARRIRTFTGTTITPKRKIHVEFWRMMWQSKKPNHATEEDVFLSEAPFFSLASRRWKSPKVPPSRVANKRPFGALPPQAPVRFEVLRWERLGTRSVTHHSLCVVLLVRCLTRSRQCTSGIGIARPRPRSNTRNRCDLTTHQRFTCGGEQGKPSSDPPVHTSEPGVYRACLAHTGSLVQSRFGKPNRPTSYAFAMKSGVVILGLLAAVTCVLTQEEQNAIEELFVETLVSKPRIGFVTRVTTLCCRNIWKKLWIFLNCFNLIQWKSSKFFTFFVPRSTPKRARYVQQWETLCKSTIR